MPRFTADSALSIPLPVSRFYLSIFPFSSLLSRRRPCAPLGGYFSAKVNRPFRSAKAGCRRGGSVKIFLSAVERIFPSSLVGLFRPPSACRKIIPAGRKRTERRERKTRLNDELQQTDIVGGERGGHRNGGKNPRTGPQSHGKGEGDAVPLFRLRGHQGSAEHRNGQPPAGQHGGADEPPAEGPANSRRRRRDNVSQADGQPQGLCPHGLLHAAVPRGCRSAADTRRIH